MNTSRGLVVYIKTSVIHYLFQILHVSIDYKLLSYAMNVKRNKYKIILL